MIYVEFHVDGKSGVGELRGCPIHLLRAVDFVWWPDVLNHHCVAVQQYWGKVAPEQLFLGDFFSQFLLAHPLSPPSALNKAKKQSCMLQERSRSNKTSKRCPFLCISFWLTRSESIIFGRQEEALQSVLLVPRAALVWKLQNGSLCLLC